MNLGFEPAATLGELWCPMCLARTWFVAWEPTKTGPEHVECRECGFCFGSKEERVVDPRSGAEKIVKRPVLDDAVWKAARAKMQADFARELRLLDIAHGRPPGDGASKLGLAHGPDTADR